MRIILLILVSLSCTTMDNSSKKEEVGTPKTKELAKSFDVEEEVLEKFKVEEESAEESPSEEIADKTTDKGSNANEGQGDTKAKNSPIKRTAIRPKRKLENKSEKPTSKKIVDSKEDQTSKDMEYPEDYPENLKNWSVNEKSFETTSSFMLPREKLVYQVSYMGVNTGTVSLEVKKSKKMGGQRVFHYHAHLKSSSYYSYIYEVDDKMNSYVLASNHIPMKYTLIQRQSGQSIDDIQLFDLDKGQLLNFYKRVTKDKEKKNDKQVYIPDWFQDPLSVIYFMRFIKFKSNTEVKIPFFNKAKLNFLSLKVVGEEKIKAAGEIFYTWEVNARTEHKSSRLTNNKLTLWIDKETNRLVEFKAEIKIGSVKGILDKVE